MRSGGNGIEVGGVPGETGNNQSIVGRLLLGESSSSQPAGHGTETTAAPSRPDPWTQGDPWQQPWQHAGGWNTSSSWWSSGGKGDYADPPSWAGWGGYRLWRRALRRWDGNTDVAVWRRAENAQVAGLGTPVETRSPVGNHVGIHQLPLGDLLGARTCAHSPVDSMTIDRFEKHCRSSIARKSP